MLTKPYKDNNWIKKLLKKNKIAKLKNKLINIDLKNRKFLLYEYEYVTKKLN